MNTRGLFSKMRGMRIVVVFLGLLLVYGAVSYSPQAASSTKLYSVELGGITGATNNTILAFGRYVVIAPFWPSKGVAENGDLNLSELDNDSLYVVDSKKPDAPPISRKLTFWDSKLGAPNTVYFPSRVLFDPASSSVYVRGTRFEENDGEVTPIDVIVYVHFTQGEDGKPVLDSSVLTIDIPGVLTEHTSEAPLDFALNANGDTLVFTNGASVFSYNLNQGYLYQLPVVDPVEYGAGDRISFLNIDQATNVVSVCKNRMSVGEDNVARVSSTVSFYTLGENGTFPVLKLGFAEQLPEGTALSNGSNIAVISDGEKDNSEFALFATNDGWLCAVDLRGEGDFATVRRLYSFPELAQSSTTDPNPLLIQYDSAKRVIGIVKPGFTVQITRPLNGKPGRITRPLNLHITSETPVLAMAKLNKKNKVTSTNSFTADFKEEGGLSNFVSGQDSQWLISTYSGKLYSVDIDGDLQDSTLQLVGSIGSRVDRLDYYADRTSVVAISSFTLGEDGIRMVSPGALVVGKMADLSGGGTLQALLPTPSVLGRGAPSIRRPCNIRR